MIQRKKKVKSLPYEHARSGKEAIADLEKILSDFGCSQFGTMQDTVKGETILQFRHRDRPVSIVMSWRGYAAMYLQRHPFNGHRRMKKADYDAMALEQGKIAVCSMLRDMLKAQITAAEMGAMSFDAVFMPHILLGSGQRVIDFVNSKNLLPAATG
ncbi:MAG: hypothetical protein C4586_08455 [Anaerolineaceae bacterium]|nr:MAG: hypothetical protein C4586_08455 [Anaerolineaceae bacterium]